MAGDDSCGTAWIVAGASSLQTTVHTMGGLMDRPPGKSLVDLLETAHGVEDDTRSMFGHSDSVAPVLPLLSQFFDTRRTFDFHGCVFVKDRFYLKYSRYLLAQSSLVQSGCASLV